MAEWKDDADLFTLVERELCTPVVGDALDALGEYHRFMPQSVQPMREHMLAVGRAMPVRFVDVDGPQACPFGLLTEALDSLCPGEVFLGTGGGRRSAYWGELLTAAARIRGCRGAVIDGFHRDTWRVLEQDWPVFSRGRFAQDSSVRTAVQAYRCAMEIEGTWVEPGDLVFGDLDGVVIVPRRIERQVIEAALTKARAEKTVRRAIEDGMSSTEAFETFGIL